MISTSAITGTGLKKCIPITRSGLRVAAASRVIEIDEVLVARIAPCGSSPSSSSKICRFSSKRSLAASTASSTPASPFCPPSPASPVVKQMRSSAAAAAASVSLPLRTSRARLPAIDCRARSSCGWATSHSVTAKPERAKTWAMPLPMVPEPTTPMRRAGEDSACEGEIFAASMRNGSGIGLEFCLRRSIAAGGNGSSYQPPPGAVLPPVPAAVRLRWRPAAGR